MEKELKTSTIKRRGTLSSLMGFLLSPLDSNEISNVAVAKV